MKEHFEPKILRTVTCGAARFTIDSLDVVTQYDHTGVVAGIYTPEDTPNLRTWMSKNDETYQGRPRFNKEEII